MANQKLTIYQKLQKVLATGSTQSISAHSNTYNIHQQQNTNDVVDIARSPQERDMKILQAKQQKLMARQWYRAQVNINNQSLAGLNDVRLMYRDVDLMDCMPEIGTALDLISEEACYVGESGTLVNVSSGSERVKGVLQDLFVNRLSINTTLPMLTRAMLKYGNAFWLLHTDAQMGVLGWKELPVYEIERYENGMDCPYTNGYSVNTNNIDDHKDETRFIWVGQQQATEYRNWQIAHFRLLYDSSMLPYGCLVGDTRIETENGYKEMSDIRIGDKVWTFNKTTNERELSEVTMAMDKGVKETFLLETAHYYLEGTSDHKVLVLENGKTNYKEIGQLLNGDLIICSNAEKKEFKEIEIDKSELKQFEKTNKSTYWWDNYIDNIPNYVTVDFAKLFGFLLGDGWLSHGYHIMFALGEHKTLNDTYCNFLKKFSGKNVNFVKNTNKKRKLEYHTAFVGSKMLFTVLKRMGFNGNAYTKRIPSWVFEASIEIKKAFLDGIIDADGSLRIASDKISYNIELTNKQLIKDIKTLAQSIGYRVGKVCKRNRIGHVSYTVTEKPIVSRHESFYINFYQEKNNGDKIKENIFEESQGFCVERVKNITPTGMKRTYDITVDNNNSNFFANGIVTHNCSFLHKARRHFRMLSMMEDMMLIYRLDRSVERRVFKINVGAIDEADVPAYVQQIADSFKRTEIIDPMTGQVDLRKNIMPVWKKTPIPLLDGRTITIEDLANEYENGKVNYVYSVQDETKQIVPGKVVWCGKNYTAKKMVKITLDDNTFMVMAPEHEVVMRDGTKKRADKICEGESVMPFYRLDETLGSKTKAEYEQVYNPNSGLYEFTHRLVAKELLKEDNENTIHHINFNRHDNTPSNLKWMSWDAHKDLHTSLNSDPLVRKSRSELKRKLWNEGDNREIYSRNMRIEFDKVVWDEIEYAIRNGEIYSQKSMVDFINENLIEYLSSINPSRKLRHNHFISKMTVRERIHDLGFKDFDEYIENIENKYGLRSHYDVLNEQKSERAIANEAYKSLGDKRVEANYTIEFDDFIWDALRERVLDGTLNHGTDILDYINTNLLVYVNVINNTFMLKMNQGTLLRLLRKKGFKGSKDYIDKIKKNHKVKSVEYINGDDVYCMTVVGLNGEEDRHNFALRTFNEDESWSDSGCFVSNCQTNDFFIPVREDGAASPIETLPAGQNLTAMDDIKYIQNKIVTALRVPKTFLNFEETSGDGKNLSLLDVRFMRTVNRIQQALLLELNKIATIHLLMLGFTDDLTNFTLEMANPSSQAEMLELENLAKKVTTAKDAVSDPGGGMPLTSMTWVWKHIFKWSDKEIQQNLEELRLETALAAELQQTTQIIKKTHIYDPVDNIYGEPGAEYSANPQQGQDDGGMGGAGGGGGMPMGGDMDFGDEMGGEDAMGAEGDMDMGAAADEDAAMNGGGEQPMEGGAPNLAEMVTSSLKQNVLNELSKRKEALVKKDKVVKDKLFERYLNTISDRSKKYETKQQPIYDKAFFMNEEMNDLINKMTITQKKNDLLNG